LVDYIERKRICKSKGKENFKVIILNKKITDQKQPRKMKIILY